MQPAGRYLGEEYHRAGGVPAVINELMKAKKIHERALTVNGKTVGENCKGRPVIDPDVIRPYHKPLKDKAGFLNLKGNLFESAIMKTSVVSEEFRKRYLSNPKDPNAFEGRAIVFDGPEDYHKRIDDPALKIDEKCILFMRGTGRLSRRRRSRQHAAAELSHQEGRARPCLHRRRTTVRHVGLALHSQCLARGGDRRRPGDPQDRRSRPRRPQ
jgi:hypothetical protein